MNEFETYIKKAAESYSLSADEKARMERVVKSYMRFSPLKRAEPARMHVTAWSWFVYLHRPIAAALVLVLVTSSTAAYAAEGALPGDALYAVKTKINEPVRLALTPSVEGRAEAHIALAERRIEEAATLAAEGRLDEKTESDLTAAFEMRAQAATKAIDVIEESGDEPAATELAERFETRLRAHENVLAEVDVELEVDDSPRAHNLARAIHETNEKFVEARFSRFGFNASAAAKAEPATTTATGTVSLSSVDANAEAEIQAASSSTSTAPDARTVSRIKSAAEKSVTAAEKALRGARTISAEAKAYAEANIERANELIRDGSDRSDDDSAGALAAFQESLRISEQTSVYIKAAPTIEKARARVRGLVPAINVPVPSVRVDMRSGTDTQDEAQDDRNADGADDGPMHDVNDDNGEDDPNHDAGDDKGGQGESEQEDESDDDSGRENRDTDAGFNLFQKARISL